jgi:hypothetical protein
MNCCICRKKIFKEMKLFMCPYCTAPFHYNHLKNWLVIKNVCPVCGTSIRRFNIFSKFNRNGNINSRHSSHFNSSGSSIQKERDFFRRWCKEKQDILTNALVLLYVLMNMFFMISSNYGIQIMLVINLIILVPMFILFFI